MTYTPNTTRSSPASPEGLEDILKAIEETIRDGHLPDRLEITAGEDTRKKLQAILDDLIATQQFALAMARGDLSQDLAVKGQTAGSLKSLQASLRHLTWQAGQIADGDLNQRVHFMGEFSDSFNAMVQHLADNEIHRNLREEELRSLNVSLTSEITERKNVEEALRLANRKITMLSSITRHDIRNQLLALRGFLALSQMKAKDPELLDFMNKEEHAAEAIGNQIEFTKHYEEIGVNAPEWQDIPRLVETARSQLPLPDTVEVAVDIPPLKVFADGLIGKVFYNLIENTLRHGEHISRIRFSLKETDCDVEIVYEDNGIGISYDDKQQLFKKGFGRNTGLGLFLSQEILAITGLTIREEGEPGKGVRFVISVPKGVYRFAVK
jgi:signal transduction histidine kinase